MVKFFSGIEAVTLPEGIPVPESMKKKLELIEKIKQNNASLVEQKHKENRLLRQKLMERTFAYEREYKNEAEQLVRLKREAKLNGGFYKEPEAKVVFAIRLKGINKLAPKPKKILQLFRLRQINNGVFIKMNKATLEMLKAVTPFITYGTPSLKSIRNLIYKRGYAKIGKPGAWSRKRILNNDLIAQRLSKYNIFGVEDLIHEIYTCGPYFKQATNFLWTFKLSAPKKGWVAKRRGFCDPRGGDWGCREDLINELIDRMN